MSERFKVAQNLTSLYKHVVALFAVATLLTPHQALADAVVKLGQVSAQVVFSTPSKLEITNKLRPSQGGAKVTSMLIENPARLVVDLNGISGGGSVQKPISAPAGKDTPVSAIALGGHKDKIRVVFHLTPADAKPAFEVRESSSSGAQIIVVKLAGDSVAPVAVEPPSLPPPPAAQPVQPETQAHLGSSALPNETRARAAQIEIVPQADSSGALDTNDAPSQQSNARLANTDLGHSSTAALPVPPTKEDLEVTPDGPVVAGISFSRSPDGTTPLVVISLAGGRQVNPSFEMNKPMPDRYALWLPGFKLQSKRVALPQFPPADHVGFTLVQAEEREGGIMVTVGVDRGTRLASFASSSQIAIKAIN